MAFYRKKNALTQQQLGEQLNVSAQAVSKWENNQSEPDIATLCKLAEIYRISVNELVGAEEPRQSAPQESTTVVAPVVVPVVMSAPRKPKKPNPVANFLKKFWWILVIVAVLSLATVVFINVWNARESDRMLKKFEQIELGMRMSEVQNIMGEPEGIENEETFNTLEGGGSNKVWNNYMLWKEYGYSNAGYEYWYYRDAQYEKTKEAKKQAEKDLDFGYDPEPWTQVRFVFDGNGFLIEAYYNAEFSGGYETAYGEAEKAYTNVTVLGEAPTFRSLREGQFVDLMVEYEDGSVFVGALQISQKTSKPGQNNTRSVSAQTCWGTVEVYVANE